MLYVFYLDRGSGYARSCHYQSVNTVTKYSFFIDSLLNAANRWNFSPVRWNILRWLCLCCEQEVNLTARLFDNNQISSSEQPNFSVITDWSSPSNRHSRISDFFVSWSTLLASRENSFFKANLLVSVWTFTLYAWRSLTLCYKLSV